MESRKVTLLRNFVTVVPAVLIGTYTASGIHYDDVGALVIAILLLGLLNTFLKPVLMLFTLPFIILTLGLGLWVVNAFLFMLVAALVDGFYVDSFVSALWGALILSLLNLAINIYFRKDKNSGIKVNVSRSWSFSNQGSRASEPVTSRQPKRAIRDDDVIDI